jgi:hypothetical protein
MRPVFTIQGSTALFLALLLAGAPGVARPEEPGTNEQQLRKELDSVKEQLRRVEEQMRRQEELLRRLSGEKPGPPAAPAPPAPPSAPAPSSVVAPAPTAPPAAVDVEALKLKILEELQPQLAAANKTFPAQFNPAIGFIVDTVLSNSMKDKANFEFRSGELGISANVDPFTRAYAIINGTPDGVDVEEAAIVTTALPYNLSVKAGRFFADFGRLSKFHDHDLPFVNRPIALDSYIGGESQSDGVEVSWLAPLDQYLTLTAGAYNKIGAANDRVSNDIPRGIGEFTYLGRAATFFSLADNHSLDLGVSDALTPKVAVDDNKSRNLAGLDLTYRYAPLASASYRGLVWGNEFLLNHEGRQAVPASDIAPAIFKYRDAFGMYSYVEPRLTRRYYLGFLFEYAQDLDGLATATKAYSPYLTIWLSEFQRLRLQYTHLDAPDRTADQFFLQWTIIMGSHVHSFRDR